MESILKTKGHNNQNMSIEVSILSQIVRNLSHGKLLT